MNTSSEITKKFEVFIKNEPLFEADFSMARIHEESLTKASRSIFYGTGLCTPQEISVGLPFDILAMVFTAERIRRTFGFDKVFHHIADTHAKSNGIWEESKIDTLAQQTKEGLEKILRNFELKDFVISMASSFDKSEKYLKILNSLPKDAHEYVRREVTDIAWYQQKQDVSLKLGWVISDNSGITNGNNETLFDDKFESLFPNLMSFAYFSPGRTFDKSRQRVAPYIAIKGENRLILQPGENVQVKFQKAEKEFGDKFFGGARKHLEDIVHEYEKLFGNLERMSIEQKIQFILDKAVKN